MSVGFRQLGEYTVSFSFTATLFGKMHRLYTGITTGLDKKFRMNTVTRRKF